jgi:hypothetical protein
MKFKIAIFASIILVGTQLGMEPSKATPASDAKPQAQLSPDVCAISKQ